MKETIYVPDIECDSCVNLISRKLKKEHITTFTIEDDNITLPKEETTKAIKIIKQLGYRADTQPFERKTLKERLRHIKENKKLYKLETIGIQNTISIFIVLMAVAGLAYIGILRHIPNFMQNYGWWTFYLIISVTSICAVAWHFFAYKTKYTCMTGMMVGMTFGMQTGMMLGAIIGATNGFFWGSMAGMLIGTTIGIVTGKCCGVMGVMEGAMAGVMGGTMGPMITVMMFSDHVLWFMPLYMIINLGILFAMSYMIYEEAIEGKRVVMRPLDNTTLLAISIIITIALGALMIYGPSSSLISF